MDARGELHRPLHILLVEDVAPDGLLIEAMLHRIPGGAANRITRIGDVAAACRTLGAGGVDVVLLDLTLPDSHGTDTVRRVLREAPEVPVVVLTGTADEELGVACIQAGAQDYLPKSELRVPLLGRVIRYALARAAEVQARRRLEEEVLTTSERERQRIAHDLHDDLGQQLTGIALLARSLAEGLARRGAPEAAAANELAELLRAAIGNSMALARGLDPLTEHGAELPAALDALARRGEAMFPVQCRLRQLGAMIPLSPTVGAHLYRIAQEALTNAVKHGEARVVEITLAIRDGALELLVSDDGVGLPEPARLQRGQGLRIMAYRARVIGATLAVERRPGGSGTQVRCALPAGS